jgi:tetratricopeptide (TPR) repeat protein
MGNVNRSKWNLIFILLALILLTGCAQWRARKMVDGMRPLMDGMKIAVNQNADYKLVKEAMPTSLVQLDGFIEVSPDNNDLLLRASEANAGYAFLFVMDTDKPRAAKLFKKARDYALRVLKKNEAFREAFDKQIDEFTKSLDTFEKEDVPALFFAANGWLSYIGLTHSKDATVLADLPKVEALMDKVVELDDTFNYGGIHLMLGAYNASKPVMFGGKPEEAKYHFEQAMEITDSKYLPCHYLYAKYYAVQIQDRELFVKLLNEVINAPDDLFPEKNFANEATRMKAKVLLEKVDELF